MNQFIQTTRLDYSVATFLSFLALSHLVRFCRVRVICRFCRFCKYSLTWLVISSKQYQNFEAPRSIWNIDFRERRHLRNYGCSKNLVDSICVQRYSRSQILVYQKSKLMEQSTFITEINEKFFVRTRLWKYV